MTTTKLIVGDRVRISRANDGQLNGWNGSMATYVGNGVVYEIRHAVDVPAHHKEQEGAYYKLRDPQADRDVSWTWSARSLDREVRLPGDMVEWFAVDQRDTVGPPPAPPVAAAPPPPPKHTIRTGAYAPPITSNQVDLNIPFLPYPVFTAATQSYALGCCGLGQLAHFSGGMATDSSGTHRSACAQVTARMAAEWLAEVINRQAYSGYLPQQALFCFTDAQKSYLTIKFLREFLNAKEVLAVKSKAHSPWNTLNTYHVELDCDELVHIVKGSKGISGLKFGALPEDKIDPKGRFKEWINGL